MSRNQTKTQGKRSIYFPQFLIDILGLERIQERNASQSRRITEVASRYTWIVNEAIAGALEKFSAGELRYLASIPNDLGWVEPENENNSLGAVVSRAAVEKPPKSDISVPELLSKIDSLTRIQTVAICEWIDRVSVIGTDRMEHYL